MLQAYISNIVLEASDWLKLFFLTTLFKGGLRIYSPRLAEQLSHDSITTLPLPQRTNSTETHNNHAFNVALRFAKYTTPRFQSLASFRTAQRYNSAWMNISYSEKKVALTRYIYHLEIGVAFCSGGGYDDELKVSSRAQRAAWLTSSPQGGFSSLGV